MPDLPSHGFSSGLHVYQRNMAGFCEGLHAVLHDVAQRDQAASCFPTVRPTKLERRKTFMLGLSFGGLVAFSYALQYPASYRYDESDTDEIPIDGLVGVGPMVAYNAKFVVVNTALRWLFLVLLFVFGLGRLEAIVPHKKVVDKDPKVYESLVMQDPRSHKGSFRIGHLWCIVKAMEDLRQRAHEIRHPVYIQMGGDDRVADNMAALKWIRETQSQDKRYEVYPICQHVIYKKAKTQHDDLAGRISVIADNVEWMIERSLRCLRAESDASHRTRAIRARSAEAPREHHCSTKTTTRLPSPPRSPHHPASRTGTSTSPRSSTQVDIETKAMYCQIICADGDSMRIGEMRLYRRTWNFREDSRPFLYDPHAV